MEGRDVYHVASMARRRKPNFFTDVTSAMLRLSHRVPLIGLIAAIACGWGWWRLRDEGALPWRVLAISLAVAGVILALIAVIGFLRNLFPESGSSARGRR